MKKYFIKGTALSILFAASFSSSAYAACSCPSGYSKVAGVSVGSATAKVCRKIWYTTKSSKAACDIGFVLQRNVYGNRDRCASIWGKTGYTIPHGTTGIAGHPSRYGWSLKVKSGRDKWTKSVKNERITACAG